MMDIRRRPYIWLWMAFLLFGIRPVWCQTSSEFMDIKEVKPGMRGYGLTVFQGTQIDTFYVEVLGIMKNIFYAKHDLIMVRVSGPYVDDAGVIAGMSGSPIYIDGKLVGALAYSFGQLPKEPIAGITPIGQMLAIQDAVTYDSQPKDGEPVDQSGSGLREMRAPVQPVGPSSDTPFLKPISVPMVFSGFNPAAVELFENTFRQKGLIPLMGGGGSIQTEETENIPRIDEHTLEPGSAVGAQLIRGDFNMAGTGTVTYRNDKTVLAFGHPYLWSGALNIPMTQADIITVIPDQASSTKIGNVTKVVGAVLWDHTNGLYGKLGDTAQMIPVEIAFHVGNQLVNTYQFDVMMSTAWTPTLVNMGVANTILGNGRLGGERTIRLAGRVAMRGYPDIMLDDLFSGQLTLLSMTTNVTRMLNTVLDNRFVTPHIESLNLTIRSTSDRRTAVIEGVWYNQNEVHPGDELEVSVFLRPYRGDRIIKKIKIPVPKHLERGTVQILVGSAQALTQHEMRSAPQRFRPDDVEQLIDLLNKRRTNNRVYVKLYQTNTGGFVKGTEMPALPPSVLSVMNSDRINGSFTVIRELVLAEKVIETDYVITGQSRGRLTVKQ